MIDKHTIHFQNPNPITRKIPRNYAVSWDFPFCRKLLNLPNDYFLTTS